MHFLSLVSLSPGINSSVDPNALVQTFLCFFVCTKFIDLNSNIPNPLLICWCLLAIIDLNYEMLPSLIT